MNRSLSAYSGEIDHSFRRLPTTYFEERDVPLDDSKSLIAKLEIVVGSNRNMQSVFTALWQGAFRGLITQRMLKDYNEERTRDIIERGKEVLQWLKTEFMKQ